MTEEAKIAYDLHQVIRHQLAWDQKPEGDITVDFDTPVKFSRQALATISKESSDNTRRMR